MPSLEDLPFDRPLPPMISSGIGAMPGPGDPTAAPAGVRQLGLGPESHCHGL